MAGIESITNEILAAGREKAEAITAKARAEAEALLRETEAQIRDSEVKNSARIREETERTRQRAQSQAGLVRRQTLLSARQEILDEMIEKAYASLAGQKSGAYFSMIETLLAKNVRRGKGEILFGEADLARLPKDFPERAAKAAKAAGGELTVSKEAAPIDNGFILRYGGIEENCTLRAIFAAKRNELSDAVLGALGH